MRTLAQRWAWVLAVWMAAGVAATAAVVKDIRVEWPGAKLDEGSVRERLATRAGEEFDRARVMQDVRELEKTGRYSDVRVRAEPQRDGVTVVYTVSPRLRIGSLTVEGADAISNEKVRNLMELGVGDFVDEAALAAGARKVQDYYFKYYHPEARVIWTVEPVASRAEARVHIQIKEGPKAVIRDFAFEGNHVLDEAALRAQLASRRYRWYNPVHWFTSAGRLDEDSLAADVYQIRKLYADRGYLDVQVADPVVQSAGHKRVRIAFRITEGRRYTLAAIRLVGTDKIPAADIQRVIRVKSGDVASRKAIDDATEAILDYYGNRGYIRTDVEPQIDPDAVAGQANVTYAIREGEISHIRDIRITGNVQTQDRVIRRELLVEPGQKFHRTRIKGSERRLQNLGYFSTVFSYNEPCPDPNYSDLVFQVEEQRMGQASVGAGFSSIDSFATFFELSHGNMDLSQWPPVGAGQKLRLRGTIGDKRTDAEISFIEPWFLDRRLALGVDLYHRDLRYESSEYKLGQNGGEISLTRPIGRFERLRVSYGLEDIRVYDVADSASDAIKAEEGSALKSFSTVTFSHDTRDQLWAPTRGNSSRALAALAGGPLGADVDWYKFDLQTAQHFPLFSTNHVLRIRGRIGVIEEYGDSTHVPIFDRYFLGGPMSVRAFKYRKVGPVDEDREPIGGRSLAFASAEYFYRVHRILRVSAYVDGGMVWTDAYDYGTDWNSGFGVGLYLDIPYLPLQFFYAWPIQSEPYNHRDNGRFSFMMGRTF